MSEILGVKVLVLDSNDVSKFKEAVASNYNQELDINSLLIDSEDGPSVDEERLIEAQKAKLDYMDLCKWEDFDPSEINSLQIGQCFKAIRSDSKMYTYQVMAKTKTCSLYYPLNDEDHLPVTVYAVNKYNGETGQWERQCVDTLDNAKSILSEHGENKCFYLVTDVNNEPVDGFFDDDCDDCDEESLIDHARFCSVTEDGDRLFYPVNDILSVMDIYKDFKSAFQQMVENTKKTSSN